MRIDLVAVSDSLGGAELYLVNLGEALVDAGAGVRITGAPDSLILARARRQGLDVRELRIGSKLGRSTAPANMLRFGEARRRVLAAIEEQAADGGWTLLQFKWEELLWAGDAAPSRVCVLEHGPVPAQLLRVPWARRRLERAFRSAAILAAVSDPARSALRVLTGREPLWLPAGVARRTSAPGGLRDRYASSGKLVAYAGRITRDKGVFDLAALAAAQPSLSVVLAGDGPDLPALRSWVGRHGLERRVHLLGFVDDPVSLLAVADATMLVSVEAGEGRPLAALESLSAGTPVVGLHASPALRSLAAEFPGAVELVESSRPADLWAAVLAAIERGCEPQPAPGWDEPAAVLLDAIGRAEARGAVGAAA